MLVCGHKVIGFVGFSSFFSEGWIFSGWLLLVLSQSVILIGFWLTLSINWRHNVISWSFTETKVIPASSEAITWFQLPDILKRLQVYSLWALQNAELLLFLNFKAQVAFSKVTLAKDELTYSGLSKILVPPNGLHHAKVVVAPRNCWEVAFPNFSPAPGGLLGLGRQPVPITCSRELGAGAVGRVKTSSPCLSPPVVC